MGTRLPVFLLIVGEVFGVGASVVSAQPYSKVALLITAARYCSDPYGPRSESPYTFFHGEPIRIKVTLANQGSVETTLRFPASTELALAPSGASQSTLGTFENVGVLHPAGREPIEWPRELRLDVGERFEFEAALRFPDVSGEYDVTFDSAIVDSSGKPLAPRANRFRFALRDPKRFEAAWALRRACTAYLADDDATSSQAIRSLLEIHPNSFVAYSLRGQLAERRRDFNEARASYERAAVILEAGLDLLYLEPLRGLHISHQPTAAEFRRRAASLVP